MNAILMAVALVAPTVAVGVVQWAISRRLRKTRQQRETDPWE